MHMGGTNHRKRPGPAESAQTVMDFAVAAVVLAELMPPIRQPKPESRRLREGCPILCHSSNATGPNSLKEARDGRETQFASARMPSPKSVSPKGSHRRKPHCRQRSTCGCGKDHISHSFDRVIDRFQDLEGLEIGLHPDRGAKLHFLRDRQGGIDGPERETKHPPWSARSPRRRPRPAAAPGSVNPDRKAPRGPRRAQSSRPAPVHGQWS